MWPARLLVVDVVDPRRLLPPEQGAMILVLGGTAVLAISLVVALARGGSRLQHRSQPTPSVGPRPKRTATTPKSSSASPSSSSRTRVSSPCPQQELLLKTAARAGIGTPQVVTANPGPHCLLLVDCLTCRPSGEEACDWKEESLEEALHQFEPDGEVTKVSCRPEDPRACIFEIRTGDVGS